MDIFAVNAKKVDKRIILNTLEMEDGSFEKYPVGSFPFEHLLMFQTQPFKLITQTTCTQNTFITELTDLSTFKQFKILSKSVTGSAFGFFFYESCIWLAKKKQKDQIPFFYNVQTVNVFNNIRWSFIILSKDYSLPSVSFAFPAATWSEREIQDMFTVRFTNLQDTRRLLLDYKVTRGVLSPETNFKGVNLFSSFYDLHYV